ncbi:MAG TPA: coenzyme F420-0:L-glutamate ligase [Candidatus Peribacterales bacterium]|nr:coenzyme F420-0:L-glutamate ligase [Candidatus Peribacterales bacterium]
MEILPIQTRRIHAGDDLVPLLNVAKLQPLDILVLSSKGVATAEGRIFELKNFGASKEAEKYAKACGRSPEFCEAVLVETKRMNGIVHSTCPGAILTEVKPWSALIESFSHHSTHSSTSSQLSREKRGTILIANAGLDESNVPQGTAIGWPEDAVESAHRLREKLETVVGGHIAIIITDSCVRPGRWGVTAFALAVAGIDPLHDEAGKADLFGRKLRITKEAIADQLATAANMLMGNADQSIPAAIVRDHGMVLSKYEGWVPGIDPEEDLFREM